MDKLLSVSQTNRPAPASPKLAVALIAPSHYAIAA